MLFHIPQRRQFHGRSRRRSAWRNGCFVLCCRRPTQFVEAQQVSSLMSAHVCLQLITKARRKRRRSFNFRSCTFRCWHLVLHFQVLHILVLHFQHPIVDQGSDLLFPIAQGTLPWQPILASKLAKLAYLPLFVALAFGNGLQYRTSDFKRSVYDDLATSCKHVVNLAQ